jgi:hypothetical protein
VPYKRLARLFSKLGRGLVSPYDTLKFFHGPLVCYSCKPRCFQMYMHFKYGLSLACWLK